MATWWNDSSSSTEPAVSLRASIAVVIDSGRATCSAACVSPISIVRLQVENGAVNGSATSSTSSHAHAVRTRRDGRENAPLLVDRRTRDAGRVTMRESNYKACATSAIREIVRVLVQSSDRRPSHSHTNVGVHLRADICV